MLIKVIYHVGTVAIVRILRRYLKIYFFFMILSVNIGTNLTQYKLRKGPVTKTLSKFAKTKEHLTILWEISSNSNFDNMNKGKTVLFHKGSKFDCSGTQNDILLRKVQPLKTHFANLYQFQCRICLLSLSYTNDKNRQSIGPPQNFYNCTQWIDTDANLRPFQLYISHIRMVGG